MAINGGSINAFLTLDTSGYSSAMTQAASQLTEAANQGSTAAARAQSLGGALQTLGTKATMTMTLPIVAAGTAAAKAAVDYESAFAGVRKTVDATDAEYKGLSDGILALSREIPQSANGLAGIMEIAGQLGVGKDNLLAFTEVIANLGVATNLSGEEAATMLAQYANITQMPLTDIDRLGSVIVDLGNNCATTEKDITEMMQRLAGTGALMGLSDAQIAGLAATMSSLGIEAEAGGSAMSRTLQKMNTAVLDGGDDLKGFADVAGMSADSFSAAWKNDPMVAMDAFLNGLGRISDAGGNASGTLAELDLTDLRIVDTLLRMSGAQGMLTSNIELANNAWKSNTALTNEAEKRYATTESKLQLTKNSITNMASSLGNFLLPIASTAADGISAAADYLSGLDESTQRLIVSGAAAVAAIGPVSSVVGTLIKTLSSPTGLAVAAGLAGAALVAAFVTAEKKTTQARLAERFGEISLSAQECEEYIQGLLEQPFENLSVLNDVSADVDKGIQTVKDSVNDFGKLYVKAKLGLDVTKDQLIESVKSEVASTQKLIQNQRAETSLQIGLVFQENPDGGESLEKQFNGYFDGLDAQATAKGDELMAALGKAMTDGIIDSDEQAIIDRLSSQLNEIAMAAQMDFNKSEMMRTSRKAAREGLNAESLKNLLSVGDSYIAEGAQLINDARDDLLRKMYAQASREGWSSSKISAEEEQYYKNAQASKNAYSAEMYTTLWGNVGQQITSGFQPELDAAVEAIPKAVEKAQAKIRQIISSTQANGVELSEGEIAHSFEAQMQRALMSVGWDGIATPEIVNQAKEMYDPIFHASLKQLSADMEEVGQTLPTELQNALQSMNIMEMLATGSRYDVADLISKMVTDYTGAAANAGEEAAQSAADGMKEAKSNYTGAATENANAYVDTVSGASGDAKSAGGELGAGAVSGADEGASGLPGVGSYYASGFAGAVADGAGAAFTAGVQLGAAAMRGARVVGMVKSPSRAMAQIGAYMWQGFRGGMLDGTKQVYGAGETLSQAVLDSIRTTLDIHSPSKLTGVMGEMAAAGFASGIANQTPSAVKAAQLMSSQALAGVGKITASDMKVDMSALNAQASALGAAAKQRAEQQAAAARAAAARAAAEAAAAEARRQQAILDQIVLGGQQALAADKAQYEARMAVMQSAMDNMMTLAGGHAVWYQEDKGSTEGAAVKAMYDDELDRLKADYEAQKAALEQSGTKEQLTALKDAYDQRTAALKEQRDAEVALVKSQYDLQKEMATDWLTAQRKLLQQTFDDQKTANEESDYQDELTDLKKKQRQSKSAREKRELQEQIDKMERDHALAQQEAILNATLDGYDALISAVGAGLIGLNDLLGTDAYGDTAWGTAGLGGLDNLTPDQLAAVLGSLDITALSGGIGAKVTAEQLAAALQSSGQQVAAPGAAAAGNTYQIDLSGAVIRDEDDVKHIVELLEDYLRQTQR